ncbi:MAG: hypothetical protein JO040_14910 [Gemmatimonadetes bacterium]|nr:hypothetical protein [Gemmatimonadota bacterium]
MRIVLYVDNTLPLAVQPLCSLLNNACKNIKFFSGQERLRIEDARITNPGTYRRLTDRLMAEAESFDFAFLATNTPYSNNYFFDFPNQVGIVSFSGWNLLTDLPITNGLVYFIVSIIAEEIGLGETHEENTGCINDFWWDKAGVDLGMRAAFICRECRCKYSGELNILKDLEHLLDIVSTASRRGQDILDAPVVGNKSNEHIFRRFFVP